MKVPPLGAFWRAHRRERVGPLENVRAQASEHFDNAARRAASAEHAVQQTWELYQQHIAPTLVDLIEDSPRGNPPRSPLVLDGITYMASVSSIEFAAMATRLLPHLHRAAGKAWLDSTEEEAKALDVVEIGGGYGGLAAAMLRCTPPPQLIWTIVDIPETARVARWYLTEQPKAAVLDVADIDRAPCADVVVQTRGFMEMDPAELRFYFDLIQGGRLLRPGGLLWTINRESKLGRRFADYPFDRRWRVLQRAVWPEGSMVLACLERTEGEVGDVAKALRLR